ncbi:MAG: tetratricopeptide repeat protein [Halioglobus sp.]
MKWHATIILLLGLSACSRFTSLLQPAPEPEATLAELPMVQVSAARSVVPQVGLEAIAQAYRDAMLVSGDPEVRMQVAQRLADLEMLLAEKQLTDGASPKTDFTAAIAAYTNLLAETSAGEQQDRVFYQLSKAYDLNGDPAMALASLERLSAAHPESEHYLEAQFRLAESYFSFADYARAELAYATVVAGGVDGAHYNNALYMFAWSQFKQSAYTPSINAFTAVLDQLLVDGKSPAQLARAQQEMAEDCLRVLALVFSYLEGPATVASAYADIGLRPYQHLLYESLGGLYLDQERFRDSAEVYRAYIERYPGSQHAHLFQLQVIASFEQGGFTDLIIAEKERYASAYAVSSVYWHQSSEATRELVRPQLRLFVTELASYYHALAQDADSPTLYAQAGDYYQQYISSFPEAPEVPGMAFLLAESRLAAGDYDGAIDWFERVAYVYKDHTQAADAGYAAVLVHDKMMAGKSGPDSLAYRATRTTSDLRFAGHFLDDPRTGPVLVRAANDLLAAREYQAAIIAAATLSHRTAYTDEESIVASLVIGQSHFDLGQYDDAEQAFQNSLLTMSSADTRRVDALDRVAASIYKRAETAAQAGESLLAAQEFSRVLIVAPQSTARVSAQFEAAVSFTQAQQWQQANTLLLDFAERYPRHEQSPSIPAMLVSNYEQLEDWHSAARQLDVVRSLEQDKALQGESLYLAAQYYDRAGVREQAIGHYRDYAHQWPQPYTLNLEAMHRLTELYGESEDLPKQSYWLAEIIHTELPPVDQRAMYIGANAANQLARRDYEEFAKLGLQLPLKRSLGKKKAAMNTVLASYHRVNEYGVQEFSTEATYRIGQIYQNLTASLLDSERPPELDALALEQYELLLEEQAYPFEEQAIAVHESNVRRSWQGTYDVWVAASFAELATIFPVRYGKTEEGLDLPGELEALLATDSTIDIDEQAAAWFEQVRSSDTDKLPSYFNQYGLFLRERGQFVAARDVYLNALALNEGYAAIHRNIGVLYDLYMGQREFALPHFYRYQQLSNNGNKMVAAWIADLERQLVSLAQED